jgi:hypothetical protein
MNWGNLILTPSITLAFEFSSAKRLPIFIL